MLEKTIMVLPKLLIVALPVCNTLRTSSKTGERCPVRVFWVQWWWWYWSLLRPERNKRKRNRVRNRVRVGVEGGRILSREG
jgi:hypothetical protein